MADIFISYSSKDRALAEALAGSLTKRGLSVFWDFNLIGGRRFRAQIQREIEDARAVAVIWTERSVASGFVLVEAQQAAASKKLVAVCEDGLDIEAIPPALRGGQVFPLSDTGQIAGAVKALCAPPVPQAEPAAKPAKGKFGDISIEDCIYYLRQFHSNIYVDNIDDEMWREVAKGGDIERYKEYLSMFPDGRHSKAARRAMWSRQHLGNAAVFGSVAKYAMPALYAVASGMASALVLYLDHSPSSLGGGLSGILSGAFLAGALGLSICWFARLELYRHLAITLACIAGYAVASKFVSAHLDAYYYGNDPGRHIDAMWLVVVEAGFYAGAIASAFIYIGLATALKSLLELGAGVTIVSAGSILGMLLCLPYLDGNFSGFAGWAGLFVPWQSFIVMFVIFRISRGAGEGRGMAN
jgi:hypothetical protein